MTNKQSRTGDHPARFSNAILVKIDERLQARRVVLDPFAGTGRIHELGTSKRRTIGVEIEPECAAKHPDTLLGNALNLPFADESVDAIATSPTYRNRMADHHKATDDSTRYTHTSGHALAADNSGQLRWGDKYRAFHEAVWAEAVRVLSRAASSCSTSRATFAVAECNESPPGACPS